MMMTMVGDFGREMEVGDFGHERSWAKWAILGKNRSRGRFRNARFDDGGV
jgi:hypothetical protein